MRYGLLAIGAAALFLAAQAAYAQVGDDQLATFADIYVDMQALEQDLTDQVAKAASAEDAQQLHTSAEEKMIGVILKHGWTVDQYNTIADAINAAPELRMQAVALINERS